MWSVPKAIGEVVEKLRNYLKNDSESIKGTMKTLAKLEEQIPSFSMDKLNNVKIEEEARAAWLRQVKAATEEAQELVVDMDNQVNIVCASLFNYFPYKLIKHFIFPIIRPFIRISS